MENKQKSSNSHPNSENDSKKDDDGEDSSFLVKSAEKTLQELKRFSVAPTTAYEDDSDLDDDEADLKTPPTVDKGRSNSSGQKTSKIMPQMISADIEKAYQEAKVKERPSESDQVEKQPTTSREKASLRYDREQASLMGAVLGIGERDKSKDELENQGSNKIGTLAGLGDVTDEDANLTESENTSEEVKTSDTGEDQDEDPGVSTSENTTNSTKTEKNEGDEETEILETDHQQDEESEKSQKSNPKKSNSLLQKISNASRKLFRRD